MKDGFLKDVAQAVRDEFKQLRVKQRKVKTRWAQEVKPSAVTMSKLKTRIRWLGEGELPVVFQGLLTTQFRNRLNRGFGSNIAELYTSHPDDDCFHSTFDLDPAASAWRKGLIESLWAVL